MGDSRLVTATVGLVAGCVIGAIGETGLPRRRRGTRLFCPPGCCAIRRHRSRRPALGLGLVVNGLCLAGMPQIQVDDSPAPQRTQPRSRLSANAARNPRPDPLPRNGGENRAAAESCFRQLHCRCRLWSLGRKPWNPRTQEQPLPPGSGQRRPSRVLQCAAIPGVPQSIGPVSSSGLTWKRKTRSIF